LSLAFDGFDESTHEEECLIAAGGAKTSIDDLFGILSMMFWSLIMVVTVKYSTFVMRADHNGEGGIFALLALVPEQFRTTPAQTGSERRSIFDHLLRWLAERTPEVNLAGAAGGGGERPGRSEPGPDRSVAV
jgi:hypothetical protein